MGQRAVGLLYGCEAPELPNPDESAEPHQDLIERWEKANKITWQSKGLKVRCESEGGKDLLGVWVAVGGSGEDGAPYFLDACMPLADVSIVFEKAIKRATKLWERFAKYAITKEKIKLPSPRLWLTPCEVA